MSDVTTLRDDGRVVHGDPYCENPDCVRRCGYRPDPTRRFSYYRFCHRCRGTGGKRSVGVGAVCERCSFVAVHPMQIQVDHIIPRSLGGSNDPDNLQMICANCHAYKSAVEDPAMAREFRRIGFQMSFDFDAEVQEQLPW